MKKKISETKVREIVRRQLQLKKLGELYTESQSDTEGAEEEAPDSKYTPKLPGAKLPTNRTEAGTYMMSAMRKASGITSSEVPSLIKMFDEMLETFSQQNITKSKLATE